MPLLKSYDRWSDLLKNQAEEGYHHPCTRQVRRRPRRTNFYIGIRVHYGSRLTYLAKNSPPIRETNPTATLGGVSSQRAIQRSAPSKAQKTMRGKQTPAISGICADLQSCSSSRPLTADWRAYSSVEKLPSVPNHIVPYSAQ